MFLPAAACSSDIPRLSGPATHNPVPCTFNSNYQTATEPIATRSIPSREKFLGFALPDRSKPKR
ncbi:hypothetical protein CUMW_002710 [Citrus unshiu]|nr:hypothetical protein CUMW_002710 [Citrus unshiu]